MLGRLLNNWTLKLLSLVIALILWVFLAGERHLEVGYTVPLELDNVPEGLIVANQVPGLVDVRLSGARTRLARLGPNDLRITIDLAKLKPGQTNFRRLEDRLRLPDGVRVTRLSPAFVDVLLEREIERLVPIKVVLVGAPAPGFELGAVAVKPAKVSIFGAESEMKTVNEVETDPVDLSGARESFSQIIPLHHGGTYTRLEQNRVADVNVEIKPTPGKAKEAQPPKEGQAQ